jgi:peptidoglycan/xylan/chitin deacetylase (PgdA/CDA1 family)
MPAQRSRRKAAKLALLATMRQSGMMGATKESAWRSRRLLILAYHGIALRDEHEFAPELYLPVSALRHRFNLLRDGGYTVVALREALRRLSDGSLPPRAVALTFDDGMHDFAEAVVPLLEEFRYPATVYVTTYYAAKEAPIFRMACRYLLWVARGRTIDGTDLTTTGDPLRLESEPERDAARVAIEARLEMLSGGLAEELATLQRLAGRVGVDFGEFMAARRLRVMSPDEISSLPELVDVQLHTHRHRVPLDREAFRQEIEDNRQALQAWRPHAVLDGFCYPSGITNAQFLPWLAELGVTTATTCRAGLASPRSDPLMLPRLVDSWRMTELELQGWLTGISNFLPRIPTASRYQSASQYD